MATGDHAKSPDTLWDGTQRMYCQVCGETWPCEASELVRLESALAAATARADALLEAADAMRGALEEILQIAKYCGPTYSTAVKPLGDIAARALDRLRAADRGAGRGV